MRTCVACRRRTDREQLIRLVAGPDGVKVDRRGGASGRGAYVCLGCFDAAARRGRLGRALRADVGPDDIERLRRELSA